MNNSNNPHSFHIPVMGLSFTLDTPIKVAMYGISSVVSIVDDVIMERMNEYYSNKFELPFQAITNKVDDFRAKRITNYLNTVDTIVKRKFENLKNSFEEKQGEFNKYMEMVPDFSKLKQSFLETFNSENLKPTVKKWIDDHLKIGDIDVNIMTKLDKPNFRGQEQLSNEFNDAHAALRGFVNSNLSSSVILSAGMNPRLYSYIADFDAFYPDTQGNLEKKIILKVSDYRSAIIQGKFLAKKGIWVSEYRVESGLNCGGHAFASDGYLMGPILDEFKKNKETLVKDVFETLKKALEIKGKVVPSELLNMKITYQGGVGTSEEHNYLQDKYQLDSIGWGSPFLLVPEATTVDKATFKVLQDAKEEDLYLSDVSPLGVRFNSVKGTSNEAIKNAKIAMGNPGSPCPKKFLALNTDEKGKPICKADRRYQSKRIAELDEQNLTKEEYNKKFQQITVKTCLCEGLANASLMANDLRIKGSDQGVAICPGPNIAYYSKEISLKEMIAHIYGKINVVDTAKRPNVFLKELSMYVDYYKEKVEEMMDSLTKKNVKYLTTFKNNLEDGIGYYEDLFSTPADCFKASNSFLLNELFALNQRLQNIIIPELVVAEEKIAK